MKQINVQVRGKSRKIYLEKAINSNSWMARTYVGSKVVSGRLVQYANGTKRFYPSGVNAQLV